MFCNLKLDQKITSDLKPLTIQFLAKVDVFSEFISNHFFCFNINYSSRNQLGIFSLKIVFLLKHEEYKKQGTCSFCSCSVLGCSLVRVQKRAGRTGPSCQHRL